VGNAIRTPTFAKFANQVISYTRAMNSALLDAVLGSSKRLELIKMGTVSLAKMLFAVSVTELGIV